MYQTQVRQPNSSLMVSFVKDLQKQPIDYELLLKEEEEDGPHIDMFDRIELSDDGRGEEQIQKTQPWKQVKPQVFKFKAIEKEV